MKVLVCGGRDFGNWELLKSTLDALDDVHCVISGEATGADTLALDWSGERDIKHKVYYAHWNKEGKAAGPLRNQRMLDENPDLNLVVAFPGGKGTADMVKRAKEANLLVLEILDERCD